MAEVAPLAVLPGAPQVERSAPAALLGALLLLPVKCIRR